MYEPVAPEIFTSLYFATLPPQLLSAFTLAPLIAMDSRSGGAPPALALTERQVPRGGSEGGVAGSSSEDVYVSAIGWNSMDELFSFTDGKKLLKWEGSGSTVNQARPAPKPSGFYLICITRYAMPHAWKENN